VTYETAIAVICALSCLGLMAASVRCKLGWISGAVMSVLSACLCMLCARGYYILVCDLTDMGFWGPVFPQEPYFYAFGGGVLGFVLALWLTALLVRRPFQQVAHAFVPAGMLAVCLMRLSEAFTDFGWGDMVDAAFLQRYPFAIQNMYGEWCAAVFNLEALCALAIFIVLLFQKEKRLQTALIWWAVTQIFCESLRVESIQWGFVRVQQLLSVLIVAAVMLPATIRMGKSRKLLAPWIAYAVCIGVIILMEYALDKLPFPLWLDYIVMACAVGVMGAQAQRLVGRNAA